MSHVERAGYRQRPLSEPADHVDRVRAEWAVARPDLDTAPIAIVARIGRAARYLDHGIDAGLAPFGLNRAGFDVLAALRRSGPPFELSPTDLYRGLMRTSGTITHRLARLERSGLVRRLGDPDDGRSARVALTDEGRRVVDLAASAHLANEAQMLAGLGATERESLAGLLTTLLAALEGQFGELPAPRRRRRRHGADPTPRPDG